MAKTPIAKTPVSEEKKEWYNRLLATYGTVMKEYVSVPDSLLPETGSLEPYLKKSYDYVTSLKPKPTKKLKK